MQWGDKKKTGSGYLFKTESMSSLCMPTTSISSERYLAGMWTYRSFLWVAESSGWMYSEATQVSLHVLWVQANALKLKSVPPFFVLLLHLQILRPFFHMWHFSNRVSLFWTMGVGFLRCFDLCYRKWICLFSFKIYIYISLRIACTYTIILIIFTSSNTPPKFPNCVSFLKNKIAH